MVLKSRAILCVTLVGLSGCLAQKSDVVDAKAEVIQNTDKRAEQASEQLKAHDSGDHERLSQSVSDMQEEIARQKSALEEEKRRAHEKEEGLAGWIETGVGALGDLVSGNWRGALGAIKTHIDNVSREADQKLRDERDAREKQAAVLATELEKSRARIDDFERRFAALPADLQRRIDQLAGNNEALKRDFERAFAAWNGSEQDLDAKMTAVLKKHGLSDEQIASMHEKFSWQEILAMLGIGAGAVGAGRIGPSRAKKDVDDLREDTTEVRSKVAAVETALNRGTAGGKPYLDDLYEQVESLKVAMAKLQMAMQDKPK